MYGTRLQIDRAESGLVRSSRARRFVPHSESGGARGSAREVVLLRDAARQAGGTAVDVRTPVRCGPRLYAASA